MHSLETIFSSNIPVDCHILKGRLETEGIDCFIFDENIVWVHPFKAVAVGAVKLKVPVEETQKANEIIDLIQSGELIDENGKYNLSVVFENEIQKQDEIFRNRKLFRDDPDTFENKAHSISISLNQSEIDEIIDRELELKKLSEKQNNYTWKQFWYELFDPERDFFSYLRPKSAEFCIEDELIAKFNNETSSEPEIVCPNCLSKNTRHGYAIDFKLDILYLILSLLVYAPFPLIRKNYYCFNCGSSFKRKKAKQLKS